VSLLAFLLECCCFYMGEGDKAPAAAAAKWLLSVLCYMWPLVAATVACKVLGVMHSWRLLHIPVHQLCSGSLRPLLCHGVCSPCTPCCVQMCCVAAALFGHAEALSELGYNMMLAEFVASAEP
jgi:hypothetical protein